MKKTLFCVLLVLFLAIGASALQVTSPSIGNDKQDRIKNVVASFTITNNNTDTLTGITFTTSGGAENSKYALSFSIPSTSLGPGASATVTVNGTVPLDHPGVDSVDLKEKALKIGTVTVGGNLGSARDSASVNVFMQAVNQLAIKKARIECETKSQSLDSGDKVKNLKPGNDCSLEIEVENNFDDNDQNNLKTGEISFNTVDIRIDSSNSDVDVDENDDLDGLDASEDDSVTLDVEIDDEADDGTVTLDIRVSGKDENGAVHGEAMDVKLEIKRLSHDIQIRRVELSPNVVSNCQPADVKVNVNVLNQGKRDEKSIAIEASSVDFKFSKKTDDIELDKDDSTSASFILAVPKGAKEGITRIDVKSYFDSVALSNSAGAELTIDKCEEEPVAPVDAKKDEVKVVVPPSATQTQAQTAPKKQDSFTNSQNYVVLLAVLIVLVAVAVGVLVFNSVRKKNN